MQVGAATIAIVGGGFSGTVLAANLLRQPPQAPTRILLIERRSSIGCGVAYGPSEYPYLLNVPASRMSATSYEPRQLIEFARRRLPQAGADSYLPRQMYGEYLQDLLQSAEQLAPRQVQLERIHAEVSAIRPSPASGPVRLQVGGQQLLADRVVLACGDPSPAVKSYAAEVEDLPVYVRDPHQGQFMQPTDRSLLLIGTGLTMVDIAVAAAAQNPMVEIIALSRHGLLPASQQPASPLLAEAPLDLNALLSSRSLRSMFAAMRRLVRSVQQRGGDWRDAVSRVRECAPVLWRNLNEAERRRFLRHVRVYWDTHRHRMPPEFAERVQEMRQSGQLRVIAGSVCRLRCAAGGIAVRWRARGSSQPQEFSVDRVIDCSGADNRLRRTGDLLWRQLLGVGLIAADTNGLGLRTGALGAVIDAAGRSSGQLFYLGPMLRAAHWEATAVGELRVRAEALAAALAQRALPHPARSNAAA